MRKTRAAAVSALSGISVPTGTPRTPGLFNAPTAIARSPSKRISAAVSDVEQPGDLFGDEREQPRRIALGRDRGGHAAQRRLLVGQPVQRGLGPVARGQVAQVAVEHALAGHLGASDHELDRELAAVRAHRRQLDAPADDRPAAGLR